MISCRDEGFAAALAYSSTNPAMVSHPPPSPFLIIIICCIIKICYSTIIMIGWNDCFNVL